MRLHLLMAATALSLTRCTFDATGLSAESSGVSNTTTGDDPTTTSATTSTEPTTTTDPTSTTEPSADCGNAQRDPGEECDNGKLNNGMSGSICKSDCTLNVCGDGYVGSNEGCDDGNQDDTDACSNACKLTGCGDGVVGAGEQCDDGNDIEDDGCSTLCKTPFCGDGQVNPGEACDNGQNNSLDKECLPDCKLNVCGDGNVWAEKEPCDDGNTVDDDMCTNMCALPGCGDGVKQATEECDDGNANEDECTSACKLPVCGDSIVTPAKGENCDDGANNGDDKACTAACVMNVCHDGHQLVGMEECDDGNMDDTDACVGMCKNAVCGDGLVQNGTEQCDDANMENNDACSNTCSKCGNGTIDDGEECDDGNSEDGDTCSPMCVRLAYMVFVSSTTYQGNLGGLAGAKAKCNMLAQGKLPGTYDAWLSNDTQGEDAQDRLFQSTKPYIRVDKQVVAMSWNALVAPNSMLLNPIDRTEINGQISGSACNETGGLVWTNTGTDGNEAGTNDCKNWVDSNMMPNTGAVGLASRTDGGWTNLGGCTPTCNTSAHIYCIEQPPG